MNYLRQVLEISWQIFFFRPYTRKMWGLDPKKLSISIGARLPVRTDDNVNYFNDNFQALPKYGYTKMIEEMLFHKNIKINLNTNYVRGIESDFDHSFLSIPIDEFFDFKFGKLPYRSIIFEDRKEFSSDLPAPVINFTDNSKYTRKTQWNLLPNSNLKNKDYNTITYEIPCDIKDNPGEYYYPVRTDESNQIFQKYKKVSQELKNITFCGRTGLYKYIDMVPAVLIHLKIANDFLEKISLI